VNGIEVDIIDEETGEAFRSDFNQFDSSLFFDGRFSSVITTENLRCVFERGRSETFAIYIL